MGLFQHKKHKTASTDDPSVTEEHFFDENFQEELRNHGRWYFEKVIKENGILFKQDLDATIAVINTELRQHLTVKLDTSIGEFKTYLQEHVAQELDAQLDSFAKALKASQDEAMQTITKTSQALQEEHQQLGASLQKNMDDQKAMLHTTFEENKAQMLAMKDAQDSALQWLNQSAQALQEQNQKLRESLEREVATQKEVLVTAFEDNMSQIIEHYLLDAIGDQYDMKAQLPSIIQQMEANKQAIADDMKL